MIIDRKKLLALGFKVMGLDTVTNKSIRRYTKYYEDKLYLLVADAFTDSLWAVKFKSKKQMDDFRNDKFSMTHDPSRDGANYGSETYVYLPPIQVNAMIPVERIKTTKQLKDGINLFEAKYIRGSIFY